MISWVESPLKWGVPMVMDVTHLYYSPRQTTVTVILLIHHTFGEQLPCARPALSSWERKSQFLTTRTLTSGETVVGTHHSHRWPRVVILESTGRCENERDVKAVSIALRARHTWVWILSLQQTSLSLSFLPVKWVQCWLHYNRRI